KLGAAVEIMRPLRGRHLGHAAEQSRWRARAHEHKAVATNDHERCPAPQPSFLLRRLDWKRFGIAASARGARGHPWTQRAGRLLRRADGRAEIHERLRKIAGALG